MLGVHPNFFFPHGNLSKETKVIKSNYNLNLLSSFEESTEIYI